MHVSAAVLLSFHSAWLMEDADEALNRKGFTEKALSSVPQRDRMGEESLICGSTSFESVNAVNGYVIVQRLQNNGITLK